jgi:MFS family permease
MFATPAHTAATGRQAEYAFGRTLAGSLVGAVLEWYEFAVYGALAATVFAEQFFPAAAPGTGVLLAFGTQAVGFVARPLGGVFFGHLGDRVGRKPMLIATYVTLALATAGIGLLPTYATWGLIAPLGLVALRFVQGFALGGEFGAAVTLVAEYAPASQRGRWTALPQAGGPAGTILAAGVLAVIGGAMSRGAFLSWGWRLAFLIAIPLLLVGAWIRRGVEESPAFRHAAARQAGRARSSVIEALRHPVPILQGLGVRIGENVAFYIYTVFVISYATKTLGFALPDVLRAVLFAGICQFAAMLIAGRVSDAIGRKPVMITAALGLAAWAPVFFRLANQHSLALLTLAICVGAFIHGMLGGPEAAWITELFPTRHRYAGSSIAFQGSSIIAGGPAPLIATALMASGSSGSGNGTMLVTIYLIVCAAISAAAVASGPETAGRDLEERPLHPPPPPPPC